MKTSISKLKDISTLLSQHQTYYTFTKMEENSSDKYKRGRISAAKWLNELVYYYFEKEKSFMNEFKENLQNQKQSLSQLEEGVILIP
ncbi:hypothetical protein [Poseidonibacter ostreae]|uniref:Uncharacterized protein n=1 Tax=Poseidonibacter ostreae TaxID=2654171 RepID=A0A6L4WND2_9BACT|nr:hypothetical protein [Poseidonibacter ostreae]KAB7884675.1 hypothetical protein GBG19_15465 [Poseidonibacter ostreae]KAB7885178.1 hypothetical protein GA417_09100 [Poseidonibacter ostreae]KAB7889588.1 hypothetical protein GBG18_10565 [Poseidonibacter ostreae]